MSTYEHPYTLSCEHLTTPFDTRAGVSAGVSAPPALVGAGLRLVEEGWAECV
ncbi:hypothetical protein ACIBFB_09700 [Nocardiopsis sp. NPDC050513]|uniref:hypothetical protein n=1 Tax=Nocardiopsis sp. NPDC050513 TaxID=3364338 RepID=UPI00379A0A3E